MAEEQVVHAAPLATVGNEPMTHARAAEMTIKARMDALGQAVGRKLMAGGDINPIMEHIQACGEQLAQIVADAEGYGDAAVAWCDEMRDKFNELAA